MSDALVAVRGEAVLDVEPELATVIVTVESQDKDRTRALASLDALHRGLLAVCEEHRAAIETVDSSGVHVQPQFKDERTRGKVTGHLALRSVTVQVTEFSALGELLGRVAADAAFRVDGPYWSLRPDSPVILRARTDAVHDAVRRAREYAKALGGTISELREISDIGLGGAGAFAMPSPAAGMVHGVRSMESVEFDVTPVSQTVHGLVEARFTMTGAVLSVVPDLTD
jgi:uncharacterized protein YggE